MTDLENHVTSLVRMRGWKNCYLLSQRLVHRDGTLTGATHTLNLFQRLVIGVNL